DAIRTALPRTGPRSIGLTTSIGLGDRLGLATPGHIRAIRNRCITPILAQQSIREMTRTNRTPQQVMDSTTWGVFQEGFHREKFFGSDADHLQQLEDIDVTTAAGFTMFTIDPGVHVDNDADRLDTAALVEKYAALDFETLAVSSNDLKSRYVDKQFSLEGGDQVEFDESTFLRAAVKYGNAVAHTVKMYRHLCKVARGKFELEVSVDETESPTSPAEHYFFAAELKRLGVEWVSMAPRFIGRFEKGVDYIGDLDAFRESFARHVAVMRTLGPYKISIHSGSDKFSIYPIAAELTEGMVHLKTAGTSYLEALRAIATIDPPLFRAVLDFARERYETDKATYHVSADVSKVPPGGELKDDELAGLLDDFDARQVLHVTFGSVLTVDDGERFRTQIYAALDQDEEAHYAALEKHLQRHVAPFAET
ncbi:MAG: tagaturonate epimerase family protein, partial [Planctomycetota bacterium]